MKYKFVKPKVYKIAEARKEFSTIVNSVGKTASSYIIKNRNEAKGVYIDIETAKEYLPKKYWKAKEKKETGGERFVRVGKKWRKEMEKWSKGKPKENLSENVDKILYGLL